MPPGWTEVSHAPWFRPKPPMGLEAVHHDIYLMYCNNSLNAGVPLWRNNS
jgi:hypothetical protein